MHTVKHRLLLSFVLIATMLAAVVVVAPVRAADRTVPGPLFFQPRGLARARPALARENAPLNNRNPRIIDKYGKPRPVTRPSETISALCQEFLGKPNPYGDPAPNVNTIVNDGVTQAGSATGCATAQNEPTVAVNPANPKNIVAASNDYRLFNSREGRNDSTGVAYASFDGGKTWTNTILPGLNFMTGATGRLSIMDAAGDPALAFGPNNTVYYANLVFSRLSDASGIVVSVSRDGGLTWGPPSIIRTDGVDAQGNPLPTPYFNDKEWVTADPASGKVYVTWTLFTSDAAGNYLESPIVGALSTDFGATWGPVTPVSITRDTFNKPGPTPYNQGSYPQFGRRGELYVAYEGSVCQTLACDQPGDADYIVMAKSTDGGKTFRNTPAAINFNFPVNPSTGRGALTGLYFRINSYPSFDIDPISGRLFVTWADDRNGEYDAQGNSIKTNGDVFVIASPDGVNWTPTAQIGTDKDEVFPAVAAFSGRRAVTYYTRAFDTTGVGLDYAIWTPRGTVRLTTATSDPNVQFPGIDPFTGEVIQGLFIGDYTAVAIGSDLVAHPVWVDFRGRPGVNTPNQDIYTQAVQLP